MQLILQTHSQLPAVIRRWGCALRVLQAIPEVTAGRALNVEQIIVLYELGLANGSIITGWHHRLRQNVQCFIEDNNRVIADASRLLGLTGQPARVSDHTGRGRFIRLTYSTASGQHFVLIDSQTATFFDPDPSLSNNGIVGIRYYS